MSQPLSDDSESSGSSYSFVTQRDSNTNDSYDSNATVDTSTTEELSSNSIHSSSASDVHDECSDEDQV